MSLKTVVPTTILGFVAGALVGFVLMAVVGYRWLRYERDQLFLAAEKIQVIVAAADLPAGEVLTADNLGTKSVFRSGVPASRIMVRGQVDEILGKHLRYPVPHAEVILRTDLE